MGRRGEAEAGAEDHRRTATVQGMRRRRWRVRTFERWSLHLGALLTGLSGLGYGWLRYFGRVQGEFGIEPHPLQALVQHLHVLAAPLLLFALGMAVRGHFATKLKIGTREGRNSGLGLGVLILPMVVTGYLVQVATASAWRLVFAWVHGLASLLFLGVYLVHGLRGWLMPEASGTVLIPTPQEWE